MGQTQVLIVGGSLNGLTTAALLAQQGVRCMVVERHPDTTVQYKFCRHLATFHGGLSRARYRG